MCKQESPAGTTWFRPGRRWPRWSEWCLVGAGMVLMLLVSIVAKQVREPVPQRAAAARPVTNASTWGVLIERPVMLERPAAALQRPAPGQVQWVFRGHSRDSLRAFLTESGLAMHKLDLLLDSANWRQTNDTIILQPPLSVVQEMNPASRRRIYDVLAREPENLAQRYPYIFRGSFEEWFAGSDLPPGRLREIRRMVYKKDRVLVFADLSYFQSTMPSNEVFQLVRHISRVPMLMASLQLKQVSDAARLRSYWGNSSGSNSWESLVTSLARGPGGEIDLGSLLPPLPRRLLYRYPDPRLGTPPNADCVWTAMNFFQDPPDDRFVQQEFTAETLSTRYRVVPKADTFGDVIMLYRPIPGGGMNLIHMCVHVAGDLVFTKNGGDIYQPWVLMRLEDVRVLFSYEPDMQTLVFRPRGRRT